MSGGFSNKPKILRGAFMEYGLSVPPLFVVFQFNPEEITRTHSLSFSVPGEGKDKKLKNFHKQYTDLTDLRDAQIVDVEEETISFDVRLDATDALNEGDAIAETFGVLPKLATLETMIRPQGELSSLVSTLAASLLGMESGYSYEKEASPPMILFIWGAMRVLPVNITSMTVRETEFSTILNPTRATVSVSLTVVEGPNIPYTYSRAMQEVQALLNLANITEIVNVVVPG